MPAYITRLSFPCDNCSPSATKLAAIACLIVTVANCAFRSYTGEARSRIDPVQVSAYLPKTVHRILEQHPADSD